MQSSSCYTLAELAASELPWLCEVCRMQEACWLQGGAQHRGDAHPDAGQDGTAAAGGRGGAGDQPHPCGLQQGRHTAAIIGSLLDELSRSRVEVACVLQSTDLMLSLRRCSMHLCSFGESKHQSMPSCVALGIRVTEFMEFTRMWLPGLFCTLQVCFLPAKSTELHHIQACSAMPNPSRLLYGLIPGLSPMNSEEPVRRCPLRPLW